jgi:autotransporter-associated beta strand protein
VHIAETAGSHITINLNGTSTFSQTTNNNQTSLGMNGGTGILNVNGGTGSFHRDLIVGASGAGVGQLVLNSGTVNAGTTVKRWLIVNQNSTGSGTVTVNGGNLNLNTNTDLRFSTTAGSSGTNVVNLNGGAITSYSGNVTGNGSGVVDLMQNGSTGNPNNTFNLNGGILTVRQVVSATNNGTRTFNFNGGTLRANGDTTAFFNLGTGNASANVRNGGALVDTNTFNVTIAQALQHSNIGGDNAIDGGLTKVGAGTLTLTGTNTYTGATIISGGTLKLGSTGSIAASSSIVANGVLDVSDVASFTVGAGQSLGGSGTVVGNVGVSGTLAAGNSPGVLTVNGALTFNADSVFSWELDTLAADPETNRGIAYDGINAGSVGGSGAVFSIVLAGTQSFGDSFWSQTRTWSDIFKSVDGSSILGDWATAFASLTFSNELGAIDPAGYGSFSLSGNSLTWSAVPEPSSILAGLLLGAGLLRRRRA